ncbi:MAG: ArsI/CadI family heavy metal resistance metalloenzyme [Azospirillaceae bacterium]
MNEMAPTSAPAAPAQADTFSTATRPHMTIDISDLDRSKAFYRALFGLEPIKTRDDYAKFVSEDPPMNLAILVTKEDAGKSAGHFGVQVKSTEALEAYRSRLAGAGIEVFADETEVACCASVQNKIWANDPDGNSWEVFFVVEAKPDEEVSCGDECSDCPCNFE